MKFPIVPETNGAGGGRNFLKFKDKESLTLVIVGDPIAYHAVWANNRFEICTPDTPKAALRFRVNVVFKDPETKQTVSKIWEGPKRLLKQLEEIHKEYDLDTIFLKVTRHGTGTDTEYMLMPANQKRTPETNKSINTVQLQDLGVGEVSHESFEEMDVPF